MDIPVFVLLLNIHWKCSMYVYVVYRYKIYFLCAISLLDQWENESPTKTGWEPLKNSSY